MNSVYLPALRLALVLCALGVASVTHAAPVTIVDDNRLIRSSGSISSETRTNSWNVSDVSANNTGIYNQTLDETRTADPNSARSVATIVSNIGTSVFSASGTAFGVVDLEPGSGNNRFSEADASSQFEVRFVVDEPTNFSLSALLGFDQISGTGSRGGATLSLSSNFFNLSAGTSFTSQDFERNIVLSGILDPDTYTLRVSASVNSDAFSSPSLVSGQSNYNVRLNLAPIPVPAAVWLFASGVGLLFGLRNRLAR
ncbi:MAG: hypothetical protein V2J12_12135 [Gammaproteobacteria bacterium]|jgi:hypothetical protein|nr:hypothetical protein [Gammaproteobacteria bacterium]